MRPSHTTLPLTPFVRDGCGVDGVTRWPMFQGWVQCGRVVPPWTPPTQPNPTGGQPTHPSRNAGFPPQKAHMYAHPEVPSGMILRPLWRTRPQEFVSVISSSGAPQSPPHSRPQPRNNTHAMFSMRALRPTTQIAGPPGFGFLRGSSTNKSKALVGRCMGFAWKPTHSAVTSDIGWPTSHLSHPRSAQCVRGARTTPVPTPTQQWLSIKGARFGQ